MIVENKMTRKPLQITFNWNSWNLRSDILFLIQFIYPLSESGTAQRGRVKFVHFIRVERFVNGM